jgi:hypothetical protein
VTVSQDGQALSASRVSDLKGESSSTVSCIVISLSFHLLSYHLSVISLTHFFRLSIYLEGEFLSYIPFN